MKLNIGKDMYLKGRIGWKGLSKNEYLDKSEYKIINATALNDGLVDYEKCGYISKYRFLESEDIIVKNNDILISKDGTLGKIGYVKNLSENLTVASGIFILRNSKIKELNMDYLYHILKSDIFKSFINKKKALGSTINHLYQRDLEQFEIDIPDYKQQTSISNILNQIELKMDINNRIIMKLESMMKDIYDYWFVQFDFPNEKGKPYKSSGGKMVYNEKLKREIPQNFKYVDIGNIEKNIITGKTPPTINVENYNGEIPFITISDIRNNIFVYETEQTLSELGANTQNNKFLPIGSLCVSCIASIGEIGFTTKISQTNQQINSIIFENEYNKEFFYFALKDYFRKSYVAKTGNTFKNMNKHDFSQIKILYSEELVKCFHNAVKAYMDKVRVLYKQNSKLKHYKDFILPLLMNGQVEVK